MPGEVANTYLPDPAEALARLVAMGVRAAILREAVERLVDRLTQLESGKPWGTVAEFGGRFEAVYRAGHGGNGSEFVKDNIGILSREVLHGATAAYKANQTTAEVDDELASTFFVVPDSFMGAADGSGAVARGMSETLTGIREVQQEQQNEVGG